MRKSFRKVVAYAAAMVMAASTIGVSPVSAQEIPSLDEQGSISTQAVVQKPGVPSLSHDNYEGKGEFTLEATLWSNATATKAQLFQNGVMIAEESLTPSQFGSQNVKFKVAPIYNGEYTYYVEYSNEAGVSRSKETVVKVIKGKLPPAPDRTEPNTNGKRIVMYYPEWGIYSGHGQWMPKDIPWEYITHMNYSFFTIQGASPTIGTQVGQHEVKIFDEFAALEAEAGTGQPWGSEYVGTLGAMRLAKRDYPHVRMMMSVGGWSQSANFVEAAATPAARKAFSDSAIELMRQYEFDGIDLDWEYPTFERAPDKNDNPNDQGNPRATAADKENFTLLLRDLRAALDVAGAEDGVHYELTVAVGAGIDKIEQTEVDKYHQYVDFINLMTYDFHGAWETITGHQSQLYGRTDEYNPYDEVVTQYSVDQAVKHFMDRGVPSDKLVVGVPYYTRGWKGVQHEEVVPGLPGLYAEVIPNSFGYGGATGIFDGGVPAGNNPYYYIVETLEKDPAFTKYWDPYAQVPYLYSESKGEFYTYDDPQSIGIKLDYINTNDLGGTIIWEATCERQGDPVLTKQIYEAFAGNTKPGPKPAALTSSHQSVKAQEEYALTAQIPVDSNALSYELLENNVVIKQGPVTANDLTITETLKKEVAGSYTYQIILKNTDGVSRSNAIIVEVKEGTLLAPTLSTKQAADGSYELVISIPSKNAQGEVVIYENNLEIEREKFAPATVAETILTRTYSEKAPGEYIYKVDFVQGTQKVTSNEVKVVVPQGDLKVPTLKASDVVDGKYDVTLAIPAESNGINYFFYENGEQIETDTVNPTTEQSFKFAFENKAPGTYEYVAELWGHTGIVESNKVTVVVPGGPLKTATLTATEAINGKYNVTISVPKESNGINYFLYENGKECGTAPVDPMTAQEFTLAFQKEVPGTYEYVVELWGDVDITTSNKVTVVVEEVKPQPEKPVAPTLKATKVVDGSYDVIGTIAANSHGESYTLYENNSVIDTGNVDAVVASEVVESFKNKAVGTYKYKLELTNAVGKATSNEVIVVVEEKEPPKPSVEKPGTVQISQSTWNGEKDYSITFNMYWGPNADVWRLYENGELIHTNTLTPNGNAAQSSSKAISQTENGTYTYYVELENAGGITKSNTITMDVTKATSGGSGGGDIAEAPAAATVSHDNWDTNGDYKITFNMWWGVNASEWNLYENNTLIHTGSLQANGTSAQSGTFNVSGKAPGKYTYKVELVNSAGVTGSNEIVVEVK